MAGLTAAQRRFWYDNGFLAIPSFFSETEIAVLKRAFDRSLTDLADKVVVDTEGDTRRRIWARDLTRAEREQPFKVNDVYLVDPGVRRVILSERLTPILAELLGDAPVVCNTLSLEFGTQQFDHLDTLFMTPLSDGALVATWIALEDVDPDAGPLRYFPESNHIEPYRFSTGQFSVYQPELERWIDYMADAVDRHRLEETRFLAKAGDLFIWDAWLLHGGAEICRPGLTRCSVVTHYFTARDCQVLGSDLQPMPGGGYWMRRPPQPVASGTQPVVVAENQPTQAKSSGLLTRAKLDLRERLSMVRFMKD